MHRLSAIEKGNRSPVNGKRHYWTIRCSCGFEMTLCGGTRKMALMCHREHVEETKGVCSIVND